MKLKVKEIKIFEVDSGDLEELLSSVFSKEIDVLASLEANNYTYKKIIIDSNSYDSIAEYAATQLVENGSTVVDVKALMIYLAYNGYIDDGVYFIKIYW